MKLKGVGFFEAHIEKLLLGLMVAVAAGVVVMQFATNPNQVMVRNQELPPARAYDPVERRARELDGQMSATTVTLPPVKDRTEALAGVEARVMGGVSPRPQIIAMGAPAEIDDALLEGQADDAEYAVVTPPPPSRPVVASTAGTLDPSLLAESEEGTRNEELAAIVGPSQPFDIAAVSVEVTYDGAELNDLYRTAGDGDIRALPFNWVNSIEAFGLQLERQERQADGSWGGSTLINSMPGFKAEFEWLQEDAEADALGRDQLASAARIAFEEAYNYRRPLPLPMIAGPQWKPPTILKQEMAAQGGADKQDRANQLNRQRASVMRRLEGIRDQIEEASRGRGGDQGGRGPRGPRQGDPEDQPEGRQTQRLRQQESQLETQIAEFDAEMVELGYDPETGAPIEVAGFEDTTEDARLLEDSDARLWAHDVTAEPGKAYRYRARLVINNPMFGREPVLLEAQRPLAASPIVFSEPSEWSDPVVVAPKTAFFLTSASDGRGGALGPSEPSASIEVYTFYYGYYRRSTLTLRPGDLVSTQADMPDDLRLPLLAMGPEGDADPGAGRPGGVIGAEPGGRLGDGGQGDDAGQGEPVPDKVPAIMGVYLVDVTTEPTQAEGLGDRTSRAVAYFSQLDDAGLMRRVATEDRQGVLYQMLSRSADEGRNQGQARESLERPAVRDPEEGRRPTSPTGPSGGGKGGGGGGGGG
ncbi:MAG: hypothetical protein NCW75_12965 [Phycisphaera sp.]|nr:MAG: hypothetical protein NCW75_12965 [Phycisphaera sp.]